MNRKLLSLAVAGLFVSPAALGQVSGQVSIGALFSDIDGDKAKAQEYRDLRDGILTNVIVGSDNANGYHWQGYLENLGREDQFAELAGGKYGQFKYRLFLDDVVHNLTWDAVSPHLGIGSPWLSLPPGTGAVPSDVAFWNAYAQDKRIRRIGGDVEVSVGGPWYVRVDANQRRTEGVRALGASLASPGGPSVDLAMPLDSTTDTVGIEGGYADRRMNFSASVYWSEFNRDAEFLVFQSPFDRTNSVSTLPPENEHMNVVLKGTIKQLPLNSSLAARYTYASLESDAQVPGTNTLTSPYSFNGDHTTQTASVSLQTDWTPMIDTRVFYHWHELENDSTHINFVGFGACDLGSTTTCSNELFAYERQNLGIEGTWRFMPGNKLIVGYDYSEIDRERYDITSTEENRFFVEWKTGWNDIGARLRYQRLERESDNIAPPGVGPSDPLYLNRFIGRFDVTTMDQDMVKLSTNWAPSNVWDFGADYIWRKSKYPDTVLGRTKDERNQLYLYGTWGTAQSLRLTAFADWEDVDYDSYHRTINAGSCPAAQPACFDPNSPPVNNFFNWGGAYKDEGWSLGLSADWPFNDRLKFSGSVTYERAKGRVEFDPQITTPPPVNIEEYDDYEKWAVNLRGSWALNKQTALSAGYTYEKFEYSDVQVNDYNPALRVGSNPFYFSGAWSGRGYDLNLLYVLATYRF